MSAESGSLWVVRHVIKRAEWNYSYAHHSTFFALKRVPWFSVILCVILYWWIKHSVNPWIVMQAETLWIDRANPYPEYMSVPVKSNHYSFKQKGFDVINLLRSRYLIFSINGAIWKSLVFFTGRWDICHQWKLGKSWCDGSHAVSSMYNFHSCHDGYFVHMVIVHKLAWPVTEAGCHQVPKSFCLLSCEGLSMSRVFKMCCFFSFLSVWLPE